MDYVLELVFEDGHAAYFSYGCFETATEAIEDTEHLPNNVKELNLYHNNELIEHKLI